MEKWLAGFLSDYGVWATVLSAMAGFGGIGLTLVIQHRNDLLLDAQREERERQRLRLVLRVELSDIEKYAEEGAKHLGQDDFLFPKRAPFVVFDALLQKIDLLNADEAEKVVRCYTWMQEIPRRLSLLTTMQDVPSDYIQVPGKHTDIVEFHFKELERLARAAIEALK